MEFATWHVTILLILILGSLLWGIGQYFKARRLKKEVKKLENRFRIKGGDNVLEPALEDLSKEDKEDYEEGIDYYDIPSDIEAALTTNYNETKDQS